jgi:hypothetical protein
MTGMRGRAIDKVGFVMVLLMALLQAVYAIYAYTDPQAFSLLRGTTLASVSDSDWVRIYASRTLFVALIIGFLLMLKEFRILMAASLLGTVMPITDAWLAYEAGADSVVVYKHVATVVYLLGTYIVLRIMVQNRKHA